MTECFWSDLKPTRSQWVSVHGVVFRQGPRLKEHPWKTWWICAPGGISLHLNKPRGMFGNQERNDFLGGFKLLNLIKVLSREKIV